MNKKILYLIAGAVCIVLGLVAIFYDDLALILCSIVFIVYGVSDLLRWIEGRKNGTSSIWGLLGAFLSFGLGICLVVGNSTYFEFSAAIIVLIFSIWLIAVGIFEILGAVMYRKAMTSEELGVQAPGSMTSLVSGIIMIAVGGLALLIPMFAFFTAHIWITIGLILTGARLISMARSSGELEEVN